MFQGAFDFMNGWQVLVRDAFASPEAALVRSHLVVAALVSDDELPAILLGGFLLFLLRELRMY